MIICVDALFTGEEAAGWRVVESVKGLKIIDIEEPGPVGAVRGAGDVDWAMEKPTRICSVRLILS